MVDQSTQVSQPGQQENGAPNGQATVEPPAKIRQRVSRWADETRRLLEELLGALDQLEEQKAGAQTLLERIADLERENEEVRRSRDELTVTFGKLREFVIGCTGEGAQSGAESERRSSDGAPEPQASNGQLRPSSAFHRSTSPTLGARSPSVRH